MDACVTPAALRQSLASERPPLVIDVRREPAFRSAPDWLRGALRRDPEHAGRWHATLPRSARVVVYCVHGHEVSQGVARELRAHGFDAAYLDGGIEGWRTFGGEIDIKARDAASRWVTRERPKIDRIACPWLLRRFIDPHAEFLYVPRDAVMRVAAEARATPYDVPDVRLTHAGEYCSFDAFIAAFRLREPALDELARIVRGADTGRLDLAPQAAGLAALSSGLSRLYPNDHEMLAHGMVMYDALYGWCKEGKPQAQTWNPESAL